MALKHISKKKLVYLIKDEKKASAMYRKMGLHGLARDEHRHMKLFKRIKKQEGY